MKATMTKIKDAQPVGTYIPTEIDRKKAEVDFRLIDLGFIRWKDGRGERVTSRQLKKYQKQYTWMTDF